MTEAPAAPLDPEMLGVPLSVYAAVRGYTAEGVPLAESLAHAAIAPEAWPAVEAAWSARLAESAHEDLSLILACDEHRARAEAHVERPLPPLDEDLRAWLDVFRAFTAAADPLAFLAERRLVEVDLFRLLALWQARSAADQALREEHARLLGEPAGPPPKVEPRPPTLKRDKRWPPRDKPAPLAAAPLTASPAKQPLAETSLALDLSKIVLPFARSSGMSPHGFSTGAPPVSPARSRLGETSLAVTPKDAPALPFPGAQRRDMPAAPAPPAAPLRVAITAPEAVAPPPMLPVRPQSHLAGTSLAVAPAAAPLPFAAPSGHSPMALPTPPSAKPPAPQLGGTSLAPLAPAGPALPFGAQPAAPAPEPRLSLVAYATMHAEISANPGAAMATIARYGFSPATKPLEDAAWKAKFAAEPALRMAWMRELVEAGNRLRGK
jgi:hypothetical protein